MFALLVSLFFFSKKKKKKKNKKERNKKEKKRKFSIDKRQIVINVIRMSVDFQLAIVVLPRQVSYVMRSTHSNIIDNDRSKPNRGNLLKDND